MSSKKTLFLWHTQIEKVIRVRFENEQRHYRGQLANLIDNYMVDDHNKGVGVKKFVFGMVHLFKSRNLLGRKNGRLSKKSLILMLITWMINRELIPNAQA